MEKEVTVWYWGLGKLCSQSRKKIAHWADEFCKDNLGEILIIICNKIVYNYIAYCRRNNEINNPPPPRQLKDDDVKMFNRRVLFTFENGSWYIYNHIRHVISSHFGNFQVKFSQIRWKMQTFFDMLWSLPLPKMDCASINTQLWRVFIKLYTDLSSKKAKQKIYIYCFLEDQIINLI